MLARKIGSEVQTHVLATYVELQKHIKARFFGQSQNINGGMYVVLFAFGLP